MWYFYDTSSNNYTNFNKNLDNNQNYIVDDSIKNSLIFKYIFNFKSKRLIQRFFLSIIIFFIKDILIGKFKIKNEIVLLSIIHWIILIFFVIILPFLPQIWFILTTFFILFNWSIIYIFYRMINYFKMNIKILWFRRWRTTYRRSYKQLLVSDYSFNEKSNSKYYTYIVSFLTFWNILIFSSLLLFF